ncbi:hypothetical protein PHYBOEH_009278 [Phytophthora boehmeriae]|uniref:RING-type domain-containing protein n=1 Tax=Phytophthora boehmeriae TaxID=109152 RepID=A0A8T1X5S5_9STRA|nr:hypothetical protein PHYBOEH_009278 [Phytophthora boehmeriae]
MADTAATDTVPRLPRPLLQAIVEAAHRRRRVAFRPSVLHEELLCSICFDILCFPVTLPCGHNFDRGCILTAWAHDARARAALQSPRPQQAEDSDDDEGQGLLGDTRAATDRNTEHPSGKSCPLCRQQAGIERVEQLQVNLLLKDLIVSLYPAETRGVATPSKQQCPHLVLPLSPRSRGGTLTTNTAASAFRRRPSLRTFSSFVYVCIASVTDPPGFVLAVLLLLVLLATACSPQPATAPPAASAMIMFDTMDRVCNGLALLIHRISLQMDQMDQVSPWFRVLSFLV